MELIELSEFWISLKYLCVPSLNCNFLSTREITRELESLYSLNPPAELVFHASQAK